MRTAHRLTVMMPPFFTSLFLCLILAVKIRSESENFAETTYADDGEVVIRLHFNDTTAMKTSLSGFDLIQVTNGTTFVEFWAFNEDLIDCSFETVPTAVSDFLNTFQSKSCKVDYSMESPNATCYSPLVEGQRVTHAIASLTDIPMEITPAMDMDQMVQECSNFHDTRRQEDKSSLRRRTKRGILFPGTNWCGPGFSSSTFKDLGVNTAADRCCRDHDYCKYYISPFSWKYHLFNYRFHTVSHCKCDKRFKTCLKSADSTVANMLGRLYFNVAQTKCFTFTMEKVCRKRTWFGECLKKKKIRKAVFKDPLVY